MVSGALVVLPRLELFRREEETIQQLVGPIYLGIIINFLLWGVQITQSYYYYKSYRKTDRVWLKGAVALLFISDAFESISASIAGWRFMVDGWGDLNGILQSPGWSINVISFTDALTASIVHVFYAQKIWTLLDSPYNHIWTATVVFISCLQLTAAVGCTIFMFAINITLPELGRIKTWISIWLVTAAATDIIIAAILTLKLSRSRTGHKITDDIISKVIRFIVETGLATAFVQIVDVVLYLIWPVKTYHSLLAYIIPKVYSNSMLALLNSRKPKKNLGQRDSRQSKPIESLDVRTTQTVTDAHKYELGSLKAGAGNAPQHNNDFIVLGMEDISFPFTYKDGDEPGR